MKVDTTYRRPDGTLQPTVKSSLNKKGELVWTFTPKEAWQLKMFPNRYDGDFAVQWMFVCLNAKGMGV